MLTRKQMLARLARCQQTVLEFEELKTRDLMELRFDGVKGYYDMSDEELKAELDELVAALELKDEELEKADQDYASWAEEKA